MDILIHAPGRDTNRLTDSIKLLNPELELFIWPDVARPEQIEAAICWRQPQGDLANYPNLKLIASLGAGADHILSEPILPDGVAITRLLDPSLSNQMDHYLLKAITSHEQQTTKPIRHILILGAGQLGLQAALTLKQAGYQPTCWGRKQREHFPVPYVCGEDGLTALLSETDVIICMLPLTDATENILNIHLFCRVKPGCLLINVGRGMHLDEDDLLQALEGGLLSGAWLDVHRKEPEPPNLRLLIHPKVTMTRHAAAISDMNRLAQQFVTNLDNLERGLPLIGAIDPLQGY